MYMCLGLAGNLPQVQACSETCPHNQQTAVDNRQQLAVDTVKMAADTLASEHHCRMAAGLV